MLRRPIAFLVLALCAVGTAFAQPAPSSSSSDALALLQRVAQRYANAKSYRIESVEENSFYNDYQRSWSKTVVLAAEAPGNRYRYRAISGTGTALRVADGKTIWTNLPEQHLYTQQPATGEAAAGQGAIANPLGMLLMAANVRKTLAGLASGYKSASRLPDATLIVNRRRIPCYVVRLQTSDRKRTDSPVTFEKTLWIAKTGELVVRISEHSRTYAMTPLARFPMEQKRTITYRLVELNPQLPGSLFTFTPPSDARLVDKFPNVMESRLPKLAGHKAPEINLKSSQGKSVSLTSFRGKPVLLDVWATWCPPCVQGLAHLARIYADAKDKGLAVITLDEDDEAKTAAVFLAQHNYTWSNFHDDGEITKAIGRSPIPRTLLIDAEGKVVYDKIDASEQEIRAAIARLGPEYASLAPKLQPHPCVESK